MKALLSKAPGGPETLVLEEMANPAPQDGHVLLSVKACGVNYPDVLIIKDEYQFKPKRPFAPGGEIAGVVDIVGGGVEDFKAGDRVLAVVGWGGMSEKAAVPAARCVALPEGMPFEDGAAFLMTYGTAHHALKDRARPQAGETLLVLGAAGGVGLAAVELGKAMGARVVAAVSTPEKAELARAKGADTTLVYPAASGDAKALAEQFKEAVGPGGANVIFDGVGGDYTACALRAIAWEGRLLVVGFPAGIPKLALNLVLLKGAEVIGVFWGAFVEAEATRHRGNVAELFDMYAKGTIRPHISARYPLEQGGQAISDLAERKATGKLVVVME